MTVTTTNTYSELVGNGSATVFPFTFAAASADEVQVSINSAVQSGGYTVAVSASGTGGTVTFDTAPANLAAVLIESDPAFTQEAEFANEGSFNPATFDRVHDRMTAYMLWLKARVSALFPFSFPAASTRAGKFLGFGVDGVAVLLSGTGADGALRTDLAATGGSTLVNLGAITQNISAEIGAANPASYVQRVISTASGKQVDGIYISHVLLDGAALGYGLHVVMTANAAVPFGAGGAIGGAANGAGAVSGGVFNRYEAGFGHGAICTRTGTGAGSGVLGTAQGTIGRQSGVSALKQNDDGTPSGNCGPGSALEATNSSNQGYTVESTSEANNTSAVSNIFERRNVVSGIIARFAILLGNVRTAALTAVDILIQPATASNGTASVTGQAITLSANVTGSNGATGVSVSNAATGGTNAYGLVSVVTGGNGNNVGGRFSATGGTNNIGIEVVAGDSIFNGRVRAPNLPVYADNAAASAVLAAGNFYRTATGQVMVVY